MYDWGFRKGVSPQTREKHASEVSKNDSTEYWYHRENLFVQEDVKYNFRRLRSIKYKAKKPENRAMSRVKEGCSLQVPPFPPSTCTAPTEPTSNEWEDFTDDLIELHPDDSFNDALFDTEIKLQRQVQEEAPKEEASVSSDKHKALLAAIADTHEVLQDLGRMRPLDSPRTGANPGRQLEACHDDVDEKDNATSSSRRASLQSFASTRCLLSQHHHNNNDYEASSSGGGLPPPPHELLCPITLEIMTDPVLTCDGMTYERRAIERYFLACQKQHVLSPKTGQILASRTLIPNIAIRNMCRDYEQERERQEQTHGFQKKEF